MPPDSAGAGGIVPRDNIPGSGNYILSTRSSDQFSLEPGPNNKPEPTTVDREKRKGSTPIPDNLEELLNEKQSQALPGILRSGWELRFLRRPLFQSPVFVLHHPDGNRTGILDTNGRVKIQAELQMRGQENQLQTIHPNKPLVWTK